VSQRTVANGRGLIRILKPQRNDIIQFATEALVFLGEVIALHSSRIQNSKVVETPKNQ
jgi:hypothetical protein